MSSQTSPYNNISPADIPPCPSRASPAPPINLGARGIAEMALPPTLHQEKITLFLSTLRVVRITLKIPPAPMTTSAQQARNNGKWRGGGATGRRHNEGQGHAHNNQIDHAEGGLVDDNDDDDGHDNNDNNDDDGGCGGRDGHHRMRKGRRHDNRTNTTIK